MKVVILLVLCLASLFGVKSNLVSNGTVFTGDIMKIGEDRAVVVRVIKRLFGEENVKVSSTVTLQNSEQDESFKETKGIYIFYVVPLNKNVFELLHYWSVKQDDFKDVQARSLEGRKNCQAKCALFNLTNLFRLGKKTLLIKFD